jgi:TatD DNase family protein
MSHRSLGGDDTAGPLKFVDTHCHLDLEDFGKDLPEVLERSRCLGVTRWINVGFNPDRWDSSIELAGRFPGMSFMLGVHPGNAGVWSEKLARELRKAIDTFQPVAIGEIGLDFFRGETNFAVQTDAFVAQLDIALEAGLPVAIHMRDAEERILSILSDRQDLPTLLFHSFDGSEVLTDWIIESGSYAGVGGLATRTKSTALQLQINRIPIQQLVLETDAPYLVPNGFRHRRNTPESIPHVAGFLARLRDMDVSDIAWQTTQNTERLFERLPSG